MKGTQGTHTPQRGEPISVLHVDDDEGFAETLVTYLEEVVGGFTVTHVDRASAALDRLDEDIECVVSDYQMPGMDGLALLEAVHEQRPNVPFILLTGKGSESVAREAIEAEVSSYLPKRGGREGFERLADRIREAVSQARTRVSYREVFEKAGVGLTIRDIETGELVTVNDHYCEILGYDREELLGKTFGDLAERAESESEDGRVESENEDGRVESENEDGRVESENEDGRAGSESESEGGRVEAESESDGVAADAAGSDTAETDTRDSAATEPDRGALDGDGTTPKQSAKRARARFERAIDEGTQRFEWPTRDADGDQVCLDVRYETAEIEGERRVLGSVHDVTERKRREKQLASQNEKIHALHDAAHRIEACEVAESVYTNIVRAAEEILDYDIVIADAEEDGLLVPKAISSAISKDEYFETTSVDADDNLAAEVYRTGEPSVVTDLSSLDVTPADPEFRSVITVPIGDYGVFQAVARDVAVFDDADLELVELLVTHGRETLSRLERERELRNRTLELRREKERSEVFANAVSHDLRNPLNVATGHLSLAREACDSDHLDAVESALDRIEAITEDVLTIAREGATVNETESVELSSLVEECWENVDTQEATLSLVSDLRFLADPRRLKHVVENLIRNGIEHGGPDVTITIGALSDGDGFYIADDGPGIPERNREDVFDPGYSTADDGTGFGLAIVREMAVAHGWEVAATESADGGARFEFSGVVLVDDTE
jgi:PAS domain S-box-containing protein